MIERPPALSSSLLSIPIAASDSDSASLALFCLEQASDELDPIDRSVGPPLKQASGAAMARPSKQQASSDEGLSDGSEEEEQQLNEPVNEEDEEELEAVARSASSADEDDAAPAEDAEENGEAEEDEDEVRLFACAVSFFFRWTSWNFGAGSLVCLLGFAGSVLL